MLFLSMLYASNYYDASYQDDYGRQRGQTRQRGYGQQPRGSRKPRPLDQSLANLGRRVTGLGPSQREQYSQTEDARYNQFLIKTIKTTRNRIKILISSISQELNNLNNQDADAQNIKNSLKDLLRGLQTSSADLKQMQDRLERR